MGSILFQNYGKIKFKKVQKKVQILESTKYIRLPNVSLFVRFSEKVRQTELRDDYYRLFNWGIVKNVKYEECDMWSELNNFLKKSQICKMM